MKKVSKKMFFRFLCMIIAIIFIFVLPFIKTTLNNNIDMIYSVFVGEKSRYRGMIEIWNIDTFESGSSSKFSLLNNIAMDYQKKYKGAYVLVRNITEQECDNLLAGGQKPDIFSCSYGVAEKIKPYIQKYKDINFEIQSNLLNSGKIGDNLYGVAWCVGLYFLISTKNHLTNANIDYTNDFSLLKKVYSFGYKKTGKKEKNIYSLTFSQKNYLLPRLSLNAYYDNGENLISELSFNKINKMSQYEAYVDFLLGNSVVLLGTQRDVIRINKREENEKIQDVLVEPLLKNTDLIQYMFLSKCDDEIKLDYMHKFVSFVINRKTQQKIIDANLFPVTDIDFEHKIDHFNKINYNDIANLEINNVFLPITDIKKLQNYD